MKKFYTLKSSIFFAALLAALLLISLAAQSAYAAITLIYFRARVADPVIIIEWATGTELDTVGFYIGRSQSPDGPFTHLPSLDDPSGGFILHLGDGPIGAEYELTDNTAQRGVVYYYRLEEIDIHSTLSYYGPVASGLGVVLSTFTPTPTSTGTPTSTPVVQATGTATSTPEPDAPAVSTPTPQASGLDPANFIRVTSEAVDNAVNPVTGQPAPNVPAPPASDQNNNSPAVNPPLPAATQVLAIAQNNSVPPVVNFPPIAPNTDFVTRSAVAPMVVAVPDTVETAPAANSSLLGLFVFIILLFGVGSVYAIQRRSRT